MLDDGVEAIEPRRPSEQRADLVGAGDQRRRVALAPRLLPDRQWFCGDSLDAVEHLADAVTVAVADVADRGSAATAQVLERVDMRAGQIVDMHVVTHSGSVRSV